MKINTDSMIAIFLVIVVIFLLSYSIYDSIKLQRLIRSNDELRNAFVKKVREAELEQARVQEELFWKKTQRNMWGGVTYPHQYPYQGGKCNNNTLNGSITKQVVPAREDKEDIINNPNHYAKRKIEVIEYTKDTINSNHTMDGIEAMCYSNTNKYDSRAGLKVSVGKTMLESKFDDLSKSQYYHNLRVEHVRGLLELEKLSLTSNNR